MQKKLDCFAVRHPRRMKLLDILNEDPSDSSEQELIWESLVLITRASMYIELCENILMNSMFGFSVLYFQVIYSCFVLICSFATFVATVVLDVLN